MAKTSRRTTKRASSKKLTTKSSKKASPRKAGKKKASKKKTSSKSASKKKSAPRKRAARKWSQNVTETSDALDLKHDVFKLDSPKAIATSLKRSAERSHRRKSDPYRSAMSMLVFYINRAGKNLPASRRAKLNAAKGELRKAFGK